ncbi:MAG: hypothetical protein QW303_09100, partial [Nitrososphaerota archaeon]
LKPALQKEETKESKGILTRVKEFITKEEVHPTVNTFVDVISKTTRVPIKKEEAIKKLENMIGRKLTADELRKIDFVYRVKSGEATKEEEEEKPNVKNLEAFFGRKLTEEEKRRLTK